MDFSVQAASNVAYPTFGYCPEALGLTALFFSLRFDNQTETGRILWNPPIPQASRPDRSVIVFMNSDLLAVLDYMEREKGIKREVLLDAVSSALLTAAKKSVGPARDLRVTIDPKRTAGITEVADGVGRKEAARRGFCRWRIPAQSA